MIRLAGLAGHAVPNCCGHCCHVGVVSASSVALPASAYCVIFLWKSDRVTVRGPFSHVADVKIALRCVAAMRLHVDV